MIEVETTCYVIAVLALGVAFVEVLRNRVK